MHFFVLFLSRGNYQIRYPSFDKKWFVTMLVGNVKKVQYPTSCSSEIKIIYQPLLNCLQAVLLYPSFHFRAPAFSLAIVGAVY